MLLQIKNNLEKKGMDIHSMVQIEPKKLKSRKKITILDLETEKKSPLSVFAVNQSSRFIRKNANDLLALQEKLQEFTHKQYVKNILYINAPLCSKAKLFLEENNWIVFHDVL